ncbi:uncharacterized protein [Pseudorasbora parva]|uniref:uncharacterized protein n=1 Tax=Pseudorasbora parva TaxID=51549 RepID=UPI00351E746D
MKRLFTELLLCLLHHGLSSAELDEVKRKSVKEGKSVTLDPVVMKNTNDVMMWYFNDVLIAEITGDQSQICADDQCKERFRDRLKLDHQTGALTITHTRHTDAGFYHLEIRSGSSCSIRSIRSFCLTVIGVFGVVKDGESVSVMEGDSVTLYTGVEKNQQNTIKWYFNDTRIAQINGDLNRIFTDQCKERFRDRLKLNHQTGSLTITNITNTDAGRFKLQIINRRISEKIFCLSVCGVPGKETDKMKRKSVKEGESVTLDPGVVKHPNDLMTWIFNVTLISEITGDQSQICTDDQCKERFRDRLKLDHQTGSLTITNITTEDSGLYKLEINCSIGRRRSSNISIRGFRCFSVAVIRSGQAVAATCAGVLLLVSAAVTALPSL